MQIIFSILLFLIAMIPTHSQPRYKNSTEPLLKTQHKVSFINPGFEIEIPHLLKSTVSIHFGIGYGVSYPELTRSGYLISPFAPFADVQYRRYYNGYKRLGKKKNVKNNSGSFFLLRGLTRGKEISTSTSDVDYAIGVGWGFQSYKNRFGLSFSLAAYHYFDDKGNSGFSPFIPEINLGYLTSRK